MHKVDERGKIFTDYMSKRRVAVLAITVHGKVKGNLYLYGEQRVKDLLNDPAEQFIAITEATITGNDGSVISEAPFIALNKRHIISVMPTEESTSANPSGQPQTWSSK